MPVSLHFCQWSSCLLQMFDALKEMDQWCVHVHELQHVTCLSKGKHSKLKLFAPQNNTGDSYFFDALNVVRLLGVRCIQKRVTFRRILLPPPFSVSCRYFTCRSLSGSHRADILRTTTRWPKSHHSSASQPPSSALSVTYLRTGQSVHHACTCVCVCCLPLFTLRVLPARCCCRNSWSKQSSLCRPVRRGC